MARGTRRYAIPLTLAVAASLALPGLLPTASPAAAQEEPGPEWQEPQWQVPVPPRGARGMQMEGSFLWTSLMLGDFPNDETGLGATSILMHRWRNGLALGVGGLRAEPGDHDLPFGDPRQNMEQWAVFGELRYSLAGARDLGTVRPYVGGRAGWTSLRDQFRRLGDGGTGFYGGMVLGTEIWPSDRVALRFSSAVSGITVSDLVPGYRVGGLHLGLDVGLSVFMGSVSRPVDTTIPVVRYDPRDDVEPGAPRLEAAVHTLRPGDVLRVRVWPDEELSGEFTVEETGLVHLPMLGGVDASGTSIEDLRHSLREGYSRLMREPVVTVTPVFSVSVLGAVRAPGVYRATPANTLIDVIGMAGGFGGRADQERVRLHRGGRVIEIDAERILELGVDVRDLRIQSGDQVVVPVRPERTFTVSNMLTFFQTAATIGFLIDRILN